MSEMNLIKPPKIGVSAEASAGHRMIGPARTDGAKAPPAPKAPLVSGQRRAGGSFGAAPGIQINRRGEAPVTKLAPQTLQVLRSTLAGVRKFCLQEGGKRAAQLTAQMQDLVEAIAAGESVADPAPAPAPAPPPAPVPVKVAAPMQAPVLATPATPTAPTATPPSSVK